MPKNTGLKDAKNGKKDEFYTPLDIIEDEMKNYREFFKGKVVLCNCDDPYESNFVKYFAMNFNKLHLKKLISTCYVDSKLMWTLMPFDEVKDGDRPRFPPDCKKKPYHIEINAVDDYDGDGKVDLLDVEYLLKNDVNSLKLLKGNGDFRDVECIEMMKAADVIVTNPPFSLFREFVAKLVEYDKKFIILGNVNSITYKDVFPLIMNNKLWFGPSIHSGDRWFRVPDDYPLNASSTKIVDDVKYLKVKGVRWYTNVDHKQRHEKMILYKKYDPIDNPKYDNYDAINVDVSAEIPCDYFGMMGVPITFLDKFCPDQFEIIGIAKRGAGDPRLRSKVYKKSDYDNYSDLNAGPVLKTGNVLKNTCPRVLIRRVDNES